MQRLQPLKALAALRLCGVHKPVEIFNLSPYSVCRTLANSAALTGETNHHLQCHHHQQHQQIHRNSSTDSTARSTVHPSRSRLKSTAEDGERGSYTNRRSGSGSYRSRGLDFEDRRYKDDFTRYTQRAPESLSNDDQEWEESLETAAGELDPGDVFGTMNTSAPVSVDRMDMGSKYDDEPDSDGEDDRYRGRRNTPYWFATQTKKLCKEGKLKEAIEMLEIRMLKVERVQPVAINYNILIGACGRVGYTKMAFKLFNNMKKRGILPVDATYTALINACAESPWPTEDGIKRLRKLHGQLQEKGVNLNLITYHALMKAYAKCGDTEMTFNLFRHLLVSGPRVVTAESFSFFLFACASNKETGLMYAIQGWRCLQQHNIKQDKFTYNLLLRIARDCGIGELELANRVLLQRGDTQEFLPLPPPEPSRTKNRKGKSKRNEKDLAVKPKQERITIFPIDAESVERDSLSDDEEYEFGDSERKHTYWWEEDLNKQPYQPNQTRRVEWSTAKSSPVLQGEKLPDALITGKSPESQISTASLQVELPNLLEASSSELQHVVSLVGTDKPQNRLALIGGSSGILEKMKSERIRPDIKTFGLLTELIPHSTAAEKELMVAMETVGVKGDIDFYNGLIRRRAIRRDIKGAKELLSVLSTRGLYPTSKTYGSLAIGCANSEDGLKLIEDMKQAGFKVNVAVFAGLIGSANRARDYDYLVQLLRSMENHKVLPNRKLLEKLEGVASFHQSFRDKETATRGGRKWTKKDDKGLNRLRQFYTLWLDRVKVAKQAHPWEEYRPEKYEPSKQRMTRD